MNTEKIFMKFTGAMLNFSTLASSKILNDEFIELLAPVVEKFSAEVNKLYTLGASEEFILWWVDTMNQEFSYLAQSQDFHSGVQDNMMLIFTPMLTSGVALFHLKEKTFSSLREKMVLNKELPLDSSAPLSAKPGTHKV